MKCLRIKIRGWTSSFRYPVFISGFQPTLPVPPLSTVYGLISAARGQVIKPEEADVGYLFFSQAKAVDVETVYELEEKLKVSKTNIIKREILYNPVLYLYTTCMEMKDWFRSPAYQLLLGRSSDLCSVEEIKEIDLEENLQDMKVGCTLVPFPFRGINGVLQALPTHFTMDLPRKAQGTRMFCIIDRLIKYKGNEFLYDGEMEWGVYIHGLGGPS
ncbi:MAG: type I-B CRISPR-associated protein Cas5 [Clostridiales bacterium]|jgi:CRISPR-associated protein Cas5t|nr:type I-B CRISPR-associated protein Cas5 [Clostridiales bacterium]